MTSSIGTFPLDANTVRQFMGLEVDATSKYTDSTINSNIRTALTTLERLTKRRFADRTESLTYSSHGRDYITIHGFRTVSGVTKSGASLVANSSYYLHPDMQQTGVSTGLSFGIGRGNDYRSNPEWFDRDLDHPLYRAYYSDVLPNDVVVTGATGYASADVPDEVLMATKHLAAYFTTLASANSAGFLSTPDGNAFDLSSMPPYVQAFVANWSIAPSVGDGG